ncbi:MAG: isoaspartyl peptidase/L-asparaginase family protein, partial [Rubrivivax sp.]
LQSLRAGWAVLQAGGPSVDAVQAAVLVMEDSPHFNAGFGAALTRDATHELDASIMEGTQGRAGAVCTVRAVRNPVLAARAVMDHSGCVLLSAEAADQFARDRGLAMVDNAYFTTPRRVKALADIQAGRSAGSIRPISEADRHGTVGAVARDRRGGLAAATSTGGFNDKPAGRVGDTPIIGAGTFARDGVCAVSCTGMGELFIRHAVAYDLCARMQYAGQSLIEAGDHQVHRTMKGHGIGAGLVGVDAAGHVHAPYNTLGMARGWIDPEGRISVATHDEVFDAGRC